MSADIPTDTFHIKALLLFAGRDDPNLRAFFEPLRHFAKEKICRSLISSIEEEVFEVECDPPLQYHAPLSDIAQEVEEVLRDTISTCPFLKDSEIPSTISKLFIERCQTSLLNAQDQRRGIFSSLFYSSPYKTKVQFNTCLRDDQRVYHCTVEIDLEVQSLWNGWGESLNLHINGIKLNIEHLFLPTLPEMMEIIGMV